MLVRVQAVSEDAWSEFTVRLNRTLQQRAVPTFLQLVCDEVFANVVVRDERLRRMREQILKIRGSRVAGHASGDHEHGLAGYGELPFADPVPEFDRLRQELIQRWSGRVTLRAHTADSLTGFGGELDLAVRMPGWTNVWTRPIQNRVDMLATGVNSEVGVRVQGYDLEQVVQASEEVAAILRELPGAADVVADPVRGKGVIEVIPDVRRAASLGVTQQDLSDTVEHVFSGRLVGTAQVGTGSLPVRLSLVPAGELADEETLRRIPVAAAVGGLGSVPLDAVAAVRSVEGPATVKSENGWLRNYVRLNVRGPRSAGICAAGAAGGGCPAGSAQGDCAGVDGAV